MSIHFFQAVLSQREDVQLKTKFSTLNVKTMWWEELLEKLRVSAIVATLCVTEIVIVRDCLTRRLSLFICRSWYLACEFSSDISLLNEYIYVMYCLCIYTWIQKHLKKKYLTGYFVFFSLLNFWPEQSVASNSSKPKMLN